MGYNYPHFESPFVQGLYNWQSLIGAILALGAAVLGAFLLVKQIRLAEGQEAERQRRQFAAARARMPLLLSSVCEYARQASVFLREVHAPAGQAGFGADHLADSPPVLSSELPALLERLIESTGDASLSLRLADLLADLQVLNARISEILRLPAHMGGLQVMIEDYMIQAADVYGQASSLFAYARRETDDVDEGQQVSLRSALNLLDMRDHQFERLHETAERRFGEDYAGQGGLGAGGAIGDALEG